MRHFVSPLCLVGFSHFGSGLLIRTMLCRGTGKYINRQTKDEPQTGELSGPLCIDRSTFKLREGTFKGIAGIKLWIAANVSHFHSYVPLCCVKPRWLVAVNV